MTFETYPKWIIVNRQIRMGNVSYHRDLCAKSEHEIVQGGGWFHINKDKKIILLYGTSEQFGSVSVQTILLAVAFDEKFQRKFDGYELQHSPNSHLKSTEYNLKTIDTIKYEK